jgi:hypothetical protein
MRRSRWLILVGAFWAGLMLAIGLFQMKPFVLAQSGLLAPVFSPRPSAIAPRPVNPQAQLPAELKICLSSSGERFDLWGTVQEKAQTFYLLGIYADFVDDNPLNTTDELILVHQESTAWCERLFPQAGLALKPLNAFMSLTAALKLEQQRYRHYIAQLGGAQQFQQRLNQKIAEGRGDYLLSEEQLKALHQLGIVVPQNYRLLRQNTFSNSGG